MVCFSEKIGKVPLLLKVATSLTFNELNIVIWLLKIDVPLIFKLLAFKIEQFDNEFKWFNIVVVVACKFVIVVELIGPQDNEPPIVVLFNNVVTPLTFNDDKHVEGLSNTTLLYWSIYNAAPPAPDCNLLPFADLNTPSPIIAAVDNVVGTVLQ